MKTILIVGASGGIGSIVAKHFLDQGWEVYGTNYANEFPDYLTGHEHFKGSDLDVCDLDAIESLKSNLSTIAAMVNCSGIVEFEAYNDPSKNMDIWSRTLDVNLTGSYNLFLKLRDKVERNGSYIMMSSTDSYYGGKVNTAYAASKAGINSLTKSLALMYNESGLRVNSIAPGWVETAMMEAGGDELVAYAKEINPLNRNGDPQDVANLVDFLISDKSSYVNGQVITLDGGYTLQDPTLVFEEKSIEKSRQS